MTDTTYRASDLLVVDLPNSACVTPATADGYGTYRVETATAVITYTARPIARDGSGMPTRYAVIDAEYTPR